MDWSRFLFGITNIDFAYAGGFAPGGGGDCDDAILAM
jgi:hypothetical protein